MRLRILAVGGTIVLALSGCAGGHAHASPTTSSPPAPTTTVVNPDVIPPVITVAYVDAVFRVLFHVYGNATRVLVDTRQVTPAVKADYRSIYNDPLYSQEIGIAQDSLKSAIDNVRPHPGDGVVRVDHLIAATSSCVFVETSADASAVLIKPTPPAASEYYQLTLKQPGIDPQHLNSTFWAITYNVAYLTPTSVNNRCGASS